MKIGDLDQDNLASALAVLQRNCLPDAEAELVKKASKTLDDFFRNLGDAIIDAGGMVAVVKDRLP